MFNKSKESVTKGKVKYIVAVVILIALIGCFLLGVGGAFGNPAEYTITFNTNGGSTIEKLYVKENKTIAKPQDPTREGYIFLGWYYNNELYDFNTPVTNNVELEARWQGDGKVSGVNLNKTKLELNVGESITLVATVTPADATNKSVTWKSSNASVASVDANGKVKALKAGTATITVTTKDGNYSATATITVTEKPASYTVTFKPIVQDVTNAIMQYSMTVAKNSASYSNYQFVIYNNKKISKNNTLAKEQYNKNITTAMIKLSDGTEVTAKVVYK